ncbi:hypothetical protein OBBRIDRAFT_407880 [Obba rivulosa]|uniref:Uncharacterized protein n=1 Tax=Obba rivulosa TaxID=1052685 RepID=A0A8E2DG34_9APHY|nr:hypothetical protein OBBRIDRAFT_407880 [Obba rivulosa]
MTKFQGETAYWQQHEGDGQPIGDSLDFPGRRICDASWIDNASSLASDSFFSSLDHVPDWKGYDHHDGASLSSGFRHSGPGVVAYPLPELLPLTPPHGIIDTPLLYFNDDGPLSPMSSDYSSDYSTQSTPSLSPEPEHEQGDSSTPASRASSPSDSISLTCVDPRLLYQPAIITTTDKTTEMASLSIHDFRHQQSSDPHDTDDLSAHPLSQVAMSPVLTEVSSSIGHTCHPAISATLDKLPNSGSQPTPVPFTADAKVCLGEEGHIHRPDCLLQCLWDDCRQLYMGEKRMNAHVKSHWDALGGAGTCKWAGCGEFIQKLSWPWHVPHHHLGCKKKQCGFCYAVVRRDLIAWRHKKCTAALKKLEAGVVVVESEVGPTRWSARTRGSFDTTQSKTGSPRKFQSVEQEAGSGSERSQRGVTATEGKYAALKVKRRTGRKAPY